MATAWIQTSTGPESLGPGPLTVIPDTKAVAAAAHAHFSKKYKMWTWEVDDNVLKIRRNRLSKHIEKDLMSFIIVQHLCPYKVTHSDRWTYITIQTVERTIL